ncbi:MAG: recombinase family protein [Chloroflexota bacterium]|nr:recombinase family protein [Chloroflexota bacterium]
MSAAPCTSNRLAPIEQDGAGTRSHPPLITAAGYARVSTGKQEGEATIASQRALLRQTAAERGYALPEEFLFADDGYTGARLDRPALDRLRDLAADGAFEVVLVSAPDRLARHYAYQVVVVEELQRAGCTVVFLNHAFGDSPEERMLLQIQGVFAEYERALIAERTRRGRLFAAREGRVNWSRPPYGFRTIRKTDHTPQQLVVAEAEAEVVRQMYRWLVEEQLSSYAIQRRLTEREVPTRHGRTQGWCQSTVVAILGNPLYKGEGYYNRTGPVDAVHPRLEHGFKDRRPGNRRSHAWRPREEWIPVQVPALIDEDTWALAQEQLARNRERATRNNTKHDYLLRGLLVCGRCGRRLIGEWGKTGGRYTCSARYPRGASWCCDGRSVGVPQAEAAVWDYVRELLADAALLQARYEAGRGGPAANDTDVRERARLERKVAALDREAQRLIDAYQAGVIELPELQERRQRSAEHGRFLRERLDDLHRQQVAREQEQQVLTGLEEFCASMRAALVAPSFAVKQQVLRLVVDRIVVEDTQLIVHHIVPAGPVRLQTEQQVRQAPDVVYIDAHRRAAQLTGVGEEAFQQLGPDVPDARGLVVEDYVPHAQSSVLSPQS